MLDGKILSDINALKTCETKGLLNFTVSMIDTVSGDFHLYEFFASNRDLNRWMINNFLYSLQDSKWEDVISPADWKNLLGFSTSRPPLA
jgi:hypothetical protein